MCSPAKNPPNYSLAPTDEELESVDWYGFHKWHPEPYYMRISEIMPNHHKPDHPNGPPLGIPEPSRLFLLAMFATCLILKRKR